MFTDNMSFVFLFLFHILSTLVIFAHGNNSLINIFCGYVLWLYLCTQRAWLKLGKDYGFGRKLKKSDLTHETQCVYCINMQLKSLSLTLTKVLLLPKPNHTQDFGCKHHFWCPAFYSPTIHPTISMW